MGNEFSTRWWLHVKKKTVESYLRLSISGLRSLFDKGVSEWPDMEGTLRLDDGTKIEYDIHHLTDDLLLFLSYSITVGGERQSKGPVIVIADTPCAYGGKRYWLRCPFCTKRVTDLYLVKGEFACRHCHNLTYESVQPSKGYDFMQRLHDLDEKYEKWEAKKRSSRTRKN